MWMANKLPESCIHPCQVLISHSVKMVVLCRQRTLTFVCTIPTCFLVLDAVVITQKYSFSLSTISLYLTVFDSQTYWRVAPLVPKNAGMGLHPLLFQEDTVLEYQRCSLQLLPQHPTQPQPEFRFMKDYFYTFQVKVFIL